jgi:glycosyltransferase involved in cell wall biosynthesis
MPEQCNSPMENTKDRMHLTQPHCVVIIPAHNEVESIGGVINEIRELTTFPVVVVDDASTDDTIFVARRSGAIVIPLAVQLGAWGATQAGLRYADKNAYTCAITMDADGQHLSEFLSTLLEPIINKEAEVSIGTCTQRGSALRKIAWSLIKQVSGLRVEDLTSGFRAYNRRAIRRLATRHATLLEYQDVGVLAMLEASGIRIKEVEVKMVLRRFGISRIFYSWSSVMYYMAYTLLLSFSKRGVTYKQPH